MPKTNVTQYDTTAANNTDVGSISIAEGMAPSDVNNALRELMKHTADWVAGTQAVTALTVAGDVTATTFIGAVTGDVTGDVTGNTSGTAATVTGASQTAITALGTISSLVATTADINGGTLDGVTIGASSAAPATVTTFTSTGIDDNATSTAIKIDSAGNLGIGLTSPAFKLHVKTTGAGTDGIFVESTTGGWAHLRAKMSAGANNSIVQSNDSGIIFSGGLENSGNFVIAPWASATGGLRINTAGYVGIGTSAAAAALTVDTTKAGSNGNWYDPANYAGFIRHNANSSQRYGLLVANRWRNTENFVFAVDGTLTVDGTIANDTHNPYFIVRGDGKVGIGIAPTARLHIKQDTQNIAGGLRIERSDNTGHTGLYQGSDSNFYIKNTENGGTIFSTGSGEKMRITSSGNVGIGTGLPIHNLHVKSTGVGSIQVEGASRADILAVDSGAGADLKRLLIRSQDGQISFIGLNDAITAARTTMTINAGYGADGNVSITGALTVNNNIIVDEVTGRGTNSNITIKGSGTGKVSLGDGNLLFPDSDGSADQVITTNGSGVLSFADAGGGGGGGSTLTDEQVEDIVGAMLTGNTETGVAVTYQDSDGTIDFAVSADTAHLVDDAVTAAKLANSINTDIATGVAALPKAGGAMTGAITTNSTFDGVDVATRDGVLTSTTATASAALPKAGGAMTGAITTNSTFDGVDVAVRDSVLTSTTTTAGAALPKAGGTMSGNIDMSGSQTVDGRDLSADGTKLDTIESNAKGDQSASEIKTLLEDGLDSVHYVAGSIDLEHMSSQSVDEDNLHISNSPTDGYMLTAQSGDAGGLTWAASGGGGGGASEIDDLSDAITNSSGATIGLGTGALANDDGSTNNNTAIGHHALNSNTTGSSNSATGKSALYTNTTGSSNTATGAQTLYRNTTGVNNAAFGAEALWTNTTGIGNTAIGKAVLNANVSGSYNVATGFYALLNNTTAVSNVATGYYALNLNTTGHHNSATGANSLQSNTTGSVNTATGHNALKNSTTGSNNTATGVNALQGNTTGYENTATGYNALYTSTTGRWNSAFGYNSLNDNGSGYYNTAVGNSALYSNTTGNYNSATGANSLQGNTTGAENTAAGYQAGNLTTTGNNNTTLGYNADPSANNASNEVTFGNSSITAIRCQVQTISSLSDRRDKKDIKELPVGLDFINDLKPVKFVWDMRDGAKKGIQEIGFIAQDLDESQISADAEAYLNLVLKNNPDKLEASYGKRLEEG